MHHLLKSNVVSYKYEPIHLSNNPFSNIKIKEYTHLNANPNKYYIDKSKSLKIDHTGDNVIHRIYNLKKYDYKHDGGVLPDFDFNYQRKLTTAPSTTAPLSPSPTRAPSPPPPAPTPPISSRAPSPFKVKSITENETKKELKQKVIDKTLELEKQWENEYNEKWDDDSKDEAKKAKFSKFAKTQANSAKSINEKNVVKDTLNDMITTIEANDEKRKRRKNEKQLGEGYVKEEAKIIEESKESKKEPNKKVKDNFKKIRKSLVEHSKEKKMEFDKAAPPLPPSSKKGNDDDDEQLPSAPGKKILRNFGSEDKVNIEMLLKPGKGKKISNQDIATIRELFDNDKNIENNMSLVQLKAYIKYAYKSNIQF